MLKIDAKLKPDIEGDLGYPTMPRLTAQQEIDKRKREQAWFKKDLDVQMEKKVNRISAENDYYQNYYLLQTPE